MLARKIANDLTLKYDYYDDVYFEFVVEAVENSLKDFGKREFTLADMHKHITENYI